MVFHRFDSGWEWFFALFSAPASGDFCGGPYSNVLSLYKFSETASRLSCLVFFGDHDGKR